MTTFDTHKPGDDEAILRTRFIAPPADKLAARFYRLPPGEKRDVLAQAVARLYPTEGS